MIVSDEIKKDRKKRLNDTLDSLQKILRELDQIRISSSLLDAANEALAKLETSIRDELKSENG